MSDVLIIGLSVLVAFLCALSLAEWAANRLARSLREQRRNEHQRNEMPDPLYDQEQGQGEH